LTGEEKGGGEQIDVYSASYYIPLPPPASPVRLTPLGWRAGLSEQARDPPATARHERAGGGQALSPPARGGEVSFQMDTSS
jgi:hypothetical protein